MEGMEMSWVAMAIEFRDPSSRQAGEGSYTLT
jgi:hypothetical protein